MILKFILWRGRGRKCPPLSASGDGGAHSVPSAMDTDAMAKSAHLNEWRATVTAPIEQLCEAPSADTVRYAFSLYAEEVYAPFAARDARMADLLNNIRKGIAELTAGAPGLVESALTQHPQVFAELRRLQSGGKP